MQWSVHTARGTALTSKRIEYWRQWEGKCRLVQLLHNQRTMATGQTLLQQLGWQVAPSVSAHLGRIDRDKAKHHQLKTAPEYKHQAEGAAVREEGESSDGYPTHCTCSSTEAEDS